MKTGVLFINFGEPREPTIEEVVPFLERIFLLNASLEGKASVERQRARAHELAVQRAPGLIEEYEEIGGSPLNAQAEAQARETINLLRERGHDVIGYSCFQFMEPAVEQAVKSAFAEHVELLVALPVYPICGPSTTIAALEAVRSAVDGLGWEVALREISGWHTHTAYLDLRADAVRQLAIGRDLDLGDPSTRLVFSAHGTPLKYLEQGSRYVLYTEHNCAAVSEALGCSDYELGYQNHANRPIAWTQPDIDRVIAEVDAETVVVDACSFMHEQSETLAELDVDLREQAEARGLRFERVPVPHDHAQFIHLLADLIEPFITGKFEAAGFRPCRCRATSSTYCLNTVL
jgi:ferrochelatase